jgi:hypothetical protein
MMNPVRAGVLGRLLVRAVVLEEASADEGTRGSLGVAESVAALTRRRREGDQRFVSMVDDPRDA